MVDTCDLCLALTVDTVTSDHVVQERNRLLGGDQGEGECVYLSLCVCVCVCACTEVYDVGGRGG